MRFRKKPVVIENSAEDIGSEYKTTRFAWFPAGDADPDSVVL